ncbi:MAG: class I SAM-dependent methyltransferase [Actinomycetota bacterium]
MSWTGANLRHIARMLRQGSNPAAAVYDSLGADLWLAPAPGWLNLGLWEGAGDPDEVEVAVLRMVETLARELPTDAHVLDVGNGLGAQDPVIARVARPRRLVAVNITESQLRAGKAALEAADAAPIVGDATHLPLRAGSMDGLISVEAAFHFSSRSAFFAEARRVLRPGGVLSFSDVSAERVPRTPAEVVAGMTAVRFWGIKARAVMSAQEIASALAETGFGDVRFTPCGERVIDPAIAFLSHRLRADPSGAPRSRRIAARVMLDQWKLLRRRRMMEYLLVRAVAP